LTIFEPTRRSVSRLFRNACAGLAPAVRDIKISRRGEMKVLHYIERQRLEDVTRNAVLEAIVSYPATSPASLFGWLRETIAQRALDSV
jgi:hypothetical protein